MHQVKYIDASAKAEFVARPISQRLDYLTLVTGVELVCWATIPQLMAISNAMESPAPLSYGIMLDAELEMFKSFVQESKCVVVAEFGVSEHETMLFVTKK